MRNWLRLLSTCTCLLTAALPAAAAEGDLAVKVAVEGAFPPFNYLDAQQKLQGFDVDIANALCESAHLTCEFVIQKWEDMIPGLLAKRYDVIVSSMSMSEERRKQVAFTDVYYNSPSIFIARKGSGISEVNPETLKGVSIGVTKATAQAAFVDKFYKAGSEVTVFPESPDLYKGLADGSVDIILEDKLAIYDWLTNTKAGQCCEFRGADLLDTTYFGAGAGIALRPGDDDLRQRLNTALADIKAAGTYDMINAKYFPFSIE
ncbi:transporter substrate-binding domain-containing protein [Mangrovicella endophytica]|uniref:transporter substrate-binding domain-containing protein n=1 Tax=Mangrovicella endophytica TaxID=2066697 RepID=UPI003CCA42BA